MASLIFNSIAYGGGGGGGLFGPHHQTGSQNSRTLSPRVTKISDFFFYDFLHTFWQNFRKIDLPGGGGGFEQEVMKNKGYERFCFCLNRLKFVEGYNLGSGKQLLAIKFHFVSINPVSGG